MSLLGRVWGCVGVRPLRGRAASAKPTGGRVEAKEHRPQGIPVGVWWGPLSAEGRRLDRCAKVIIGFPVSIPSALVKR